MSHKGILKLQILFVLVFSMQYCPRLQFLNSLIYINPGFYITKINYLVGLSTSSTQTAFDRMIAPSNLCLCMVSSKFHLLSFASSASVGM